MQLWGVGAICVSAKVQKKKEGQIDAFSTKVKLHFCLGPEVMDSNSLVCDPQQGWSDPCPTLASAGLAVAGSGRLEALAFRAPSSGGTGS